MDNGNKAYNKKVEKEQQYAITVTYKHLHNITPYGQFRETAPSLTRYLSQSTDFKLYVEFRVNNGSIHYHGTIKIKDRVKWLKQTLPFLKRLGFFLVKPIDDDEKWTAYLNKEKHIAEAIVKELTFPMEKEVVIVKKKKKVDYPDIEEIEQEIMTEAEQAEENKIVDYTP